MPPGPSKGMEMKISSKDIRVRLEKWPTIVTSRVDRDDDRPFQTFGGMNGDERDGLLLGVRSSLHLANRLFPIGAHVAGEGAKATNVISARHLEEDVRVGEHAIAARFKALTYGRAKIDLLQARLIGVA